MSHSKLMLVTAFAFSAFLLSCETKSNTGDSKMAENKEIVKKILTEFNKQNLGMFDTYFAADVIDHSAFPDQAPGREGLKTAVKGMFEAYPDINVQVEEMLADGDFVITRDLWNATEKTTGKKKSGWTIHIFKFKNGMVQDEWSKGWEWLD